MVIFFCLFTCLLIFYLKLDGEFYVAGAGTSVFLSLLLDFVLRSNSVSWKWFDTFKACVPVLLD